MKKETIKKLLKCIIYISIVCSTILSSTSQSLAFEANKNTQIEETVVIQIPTNQQRFFTTKFNPDDYKITDPTSTTGTSKLGDLGKSIIKVIQTVGSALSVIVMMVIAIKYMVGSVEEKAQYKKVMMPYVVGCFLIFAITNILAIVMDVVSKFL